MLNAKAFFAIALTASIVSTTAHAFFDGLDVIYGNDDRVDTVLHPDFEKRELAKSVAGMVMKSRLYLDERDGTYFYRKRSAANVYGMCKDERFSDQPVLPDCTGFLVEQDTIMTAGHCIEDQEACENEKWVFGFTKDSNNFPTKDVYSCKKLVKHKLDESFGKIKDYAVIKLDRPVVGRKPLKLRKNGVLLPGTDVFVIGHPNGLPQKIADGARVTQPSNEDLKNPIRTLLQRRYYFTANLDTYQGNSGSPVFNEKTLEVEGILIQGAEDMYFDEKDYCYRSVNRSDRRNDTEERIFRIRKAKY